MMSITIDTAREYIARLNLDYIVATMCAERYALPRWSREDALHCCQLYKNFLLLQKIHLPTALVPTKYIDEFWHNHILHTRNYIQDCQQIFGHYLHHQPASPTENADILINDFLLTKQLYFKEFGEPL